MFGGDAGGVKADDASNRVQEAPVAFVAAPAPAAAPAAPAQPYRVLARKYRPQTFSALIGQDAMVQTLANAIRRDRLAHAFLMTGVRGVGKTSTARLIAKALNCIGRDGSGGPTIDPCGVCEPCVAIAEGRHIDVIEMDAASHTGVDDVREIIEAVRYAAVSARYKIYIIDEVHMLSRNAFNALLKTLEEPPAHVKFLFATTEVDKLPVTVLSRCQRFDLRRIPAELLAEHFGAICRAEGVGAESEALAMIAQAAEGSVRDGLSILDQAIAHADMAGDGPADAGGAETPHETIVTGAQLRDMLGLADRTARRRLFAALLGGESGELLDLIAAQFALGIEPLALVRGAMDLCHRVTVCQIGRGGAVAIAPEESAAIEDWARRLSAGQLHRLWQLLLKAHDEVKTAPEPLAAAEMALLRCQHAADMPDPGALARRIEALSALGPASVGATDSGASGASASDGGAAMAQVPMVEARTHATISTEFAGGVEDAVSGWAQFVERIEHHSLSLASLMRLQVRVIDWAEGRLVYEHAPGFAQDISEALGAGLREATGVRWQIERRASGGALSLVEAVDARRLAAEDAERSAPLVQAALAAFPGAEIIKDTPRAGEFPARRNSNGGSIR